MTSEGLLTVCTFKKSLVFLNTISAIGIGFNGAETNCGIARILGILLMNMQLRHVDIFFLATNIICSLSTLICYYCCYLLFLLVNVSNF